MTGEHIVIVDTETGETVLDTNWPIIPVKNFTEAMLVGDDQELFDNGILTAEEFIEMWGVHPANGYLIQHDTEEMV